MALSLKQKPVLRVPVGLDIDGLYLAAAGVEAGRLGQAASTDLEPGLVTPAPAVPGQAPLPQRARPDRREHRLRRRLARNPWPYTNPFNPCKPFNSERCHSHPPCGHYDSDQVPPIGPNVPAGYPGSHPSTPDG